VPARHSRTSAGGGRSRTTNRRPPVRILILGGSGQVGRELVRAAVPRECMSIAPSHEALDICDRQALAEVVDTQYPDVCINAAAYTDVSAAEHDSESAFRVNSEGAEAVAETISRAGIPLIHLSTDYVFDGRNRRPYREDDSTGPLNVYGTSKLAGEAAVRDCCGQHLIVRTAWVFSSTRRNFVKTVLEKGLVEQQFTVVDDEIGSPTSAADLAGALLELAQQCSSSTSVPWGTYHCTNQGSASRFSLAKQVLSSARIHSEAALASVSRGSSRDRVDPVRRPGYSVLDCTRIRDVFGIELRGWREAVDDVVRTLLEGEPTGGT
jgi:dTDP-4-dehydrorhamnose reductase